MIFFISDVHLGIYKRSIDIHRETKLIDFLYSIQSDCECLFIVGDLFDFWFEYKTVIPKFFYRTITCLKHLTDNGVKIEYIMGNHDFGHKDFFETELSIPVYKNDISRILYNKKFYISHGDGKSNNDMGYRIIKKIMRNPLSLFLYNLLHPDIGISLASGTSQQSRQYTNSKDFGEAEGMEDFALEKIKLGYDYIVMGHRHKIIKRKIENGIYLNCGDWLHEPVYTCFDGKDINTYRIDDWLATHQ